MTDAERMNNMMKEKENQQCHPFGACNVHDNCHVHSITTQDGNIVRIADNADDLYTYNLVMRYLDRESFAKLLVARIKEHQFFIQQFCEFSGETEFAFSDGYTLILNPQG
tara:strand:- start:1312 stop:1641 length:330 start_codon:yes stop_codon:yes gene_type:complete